jgi:hypothetical protein
MIYTQDLSYITIILNEISLFNNRGGLCSIFHTYVACYIIYCQWKCARLEPATSYVAGESTIHSAKSYKYIHTYIPLTLYSRRGGRGISDIPP